VSAPHRLRHRIAAGLAWLACFAAPADAAATTADPAPLLVGIGQSLHDPQEALTALSWLGVQSVRLDAPWKAIETAPGRYVIPTWLQSAVDSARARGIEPQLILAYGHPLYGEDKPRSPAALVAFAAYCAFVAGHFKGSVHYFDLWNEWDAHTGRTTPGSADDYVALARLAYPAIKAANPAAIVLSGGISSLGLSQGWPARFIEQGGLDFVDALSFHPYNFQERGAGTPESSLAQLDRVHALADGATKRAVPIYVTEMGYPDFEGRGGVSEDVAALYLARFVLLASTRPYLRGVWWYCLRDQGRDAHNKEHRFGVMSADLEPKAAARALRAVTLLLAQVHRFRDRSDGAQHRIVAERADGSKLELSWTEDAGDLRLLRELAALDTRPQPPTTLRSSRR
jgi:hypothetical protein